MKKRLQVVLTEEAWTQIEALANEANQNFAAGFITYSDAINEMILTSKADIKTLQLKHTDLRRSLRAMASQAEVDVDSVIKNLMELKAKPVKKRSIQGTEEVA